MPDPRLVSRAQRAATMLERAWERWRATQGLEAEPMPPVSSYVGYSIEEPWGRPRVVFGVNAEDAERLAALLQESAGHGPDGLPRAVDPGYRPAVPGAFAADRPAVPDRGQPDRGYQDRGYQDRGYQDRGYQDRGYQDRGYQDRGYQDRGFQERGFQERGYQSVLSGPRLSGP